LQAVQVIFKKFPDGESYVRLNRQIKDEHAVVVQTTISPQDSRLIQLAFLADASKRNGATKVTAIVPYLAYARQDKTFLKGEGISIETIARMLKAAGVDSLITVNIHAEDALKKFPFPSKNLSAIPLLAEYFVQKGHRGAFAMAPDKGALYIAEQAQKILGGEAGNLEKHRDRHTGQTTQTLKNVDLEDKTVILFDDIISTGGTIVGAAKIIREQGAKRIFAACVHPVLVGNAEERILGAGVEQIVGTDSIPYYKSQVSLAPLLSRELKAQKLG
jgi:ribose-phosphate pyrophosphokinase